MNTPEKGVAPVVDQHQLFVYCQAASLLRQLAPRQQELLYIMTAARVIDGFQQQLQAAQHRRSAGAQ